jgi:hypothetical protein
MKELLLTEMQGIFDRYKKIGIYPNEIYTLMSSIAQDKNFHYNLGLHSELIQKIK